MWTHFYNWTTKLKGTNRYGNDSTITPRACHRGLRGGSGSWWVQELWQYTLPHGGSIGSVFVPSLGGQSTLCQWVAHGSSKLRIVNDQVCEYLMQCGVTLCIVSRELLHLFLLCRSGTITVYAIWQLACVEWIVSALLCKQLGLYIRAHRRKQIRRAFWAIAYWRGSFNHAQLIMKKSAPINGLINSLRMIQ